MMKRVQITMLGALSLAAFLAASAATAQKADLSASGLVGKLEGATVLKDPAAKPQSFKDAPMLSERVKAGKLPPVAERLPAEPMVIQPVGETGKYGGTWRRAFNGPGDGENGNRINTSDQLMHWDYTGGKIVPSVAKDISVSADGKTTTVHLRRAMKWSDGQPFTADDFVFFFEDMDRNAEVLKTPNAELAVNGKLATIKRIDAYTVAYEFAEPNQLFAQIASSNTLFGGGQSYGQYRGRTFGSYAPGHYLKQFMPKYAGGAEKANAAAKAAGYDNWVKFLQFKMDWTLNPELPTLMPWTTKQPINSTAWVLERNPYYWAVDPAGNQLPYIDTVHMELVENTEVINLRAMAGEYDYMERFIDIAKLPLLIENQERSKYKVHLDMGANGADSAIYVNQTFKDDAEIAKWLRNVDFRRAISMGIDRDQLNETFWLGLGTPGNAVPTETNPYSPGPEWRAKWASLDLARANALLDGIGLAKKDAQGFRLRTDNGQRLQLEIMAIPSLLPYEKHAEMIVEQWRKIGVAADVKVVERNLGYSRLRASQHQLAMWTTNGAELLFLKPHFVVPTDPELSMMGNHYALWYVSGGKDGVAPTEPDILKAMDYVRRAATLTEKEQVDAGKEIWRMSVEQQYVIGLVGQSPASLGVRVVSNKLGNIPARSCIALHCRAPGGSHPETWYFK